MSQYRPAILRGFVKHWPLINLAQTSVNALFDYLAANDTESLVDAILLRPETAGRVFYNEAMDSFNFLRNRVTSTSVLEQLYRYSQFQMKLYT